MSGLFRSVQHAVGLVIVASLLALGTAAALWAALGAVGMHLGFPTILAGVGLVIAWIVVTSSGGDRRMPPPPPPMDLPRRVPLTWADIERMVVLNRQGLLSDAELDRAIRELVPPPPVVPSSGRRTGRR
jgi:hypothetical protein